VFFLAVCPNIEGITLYELADYGSECTGGWLNPDLIVAVILAESGGNPYAININGVGSFYPSSYEEAVELIYGYNRANVDIGLMQVNYLSWGGVTGLGPEEFFDPWINVCVGSQILAHYIRQNGYPGIGRYNAISPAKQVKYIRKVERVYAELVAGRKNKDSAKRF
jgi:soluble lytic murein transglycosylase-like protein